MKCPSCPDSILVLSERQGVEIDYCPTCRGIWLDRGELDKLLDRAATIPVAMAPPPGISAQSPPPARHRDFADSDYRGEERYRSGRKKSWLNEIFD